MFKCVLCNKEFKWLTNTHLKTHNISFEEYKIKYPNTQYFKNVPYKLPKTHPLYKKWLLSLKKRPPVWNKGKTKETDINLKRLSILYKKKKVQNFAKWRLEMIKLGKITVNYKPFNKSKELAFLIGLILGDGNINKYSRTEGLTISLNSKNQNLVRFTAEIVELVFDKKPSISQTGNCTKIKLYQKEISKRLNVPSGARGHANIAIPRWIWKSKTYLIWYVRGLFEAEGSLNIHLPTCTYNFAFANRNPKLLANAGRILKRFNFHPEYRWNATRLRKRAEVLEFKKLISFREYHFAGSSNGSDFGL